MKKEHKKQRPLRQSMKKDRIHPHDFMHLKIAYSCEDCAHFKPQAQTCTIGFWTKNHLKIQQEKTYYSSGEMAICRFLEVE